MKERIAVIADVHGNRWALERVLAAIARHGADLIVNLGDCLYGPLDPAGTADLLATSGALTVRGNEDRIITEPSESAPSATLRFVREQLMSAHLAWLGGLRFSAIIADDCYMCHGTPSSDTDYLFYHVGEAGAVLRDSDQLLSELKNVTNAVVLCGHDHTPHTLGLPDGRLIVNPGSVGLPAYTDDSPFPHRMQTGSPHARYSLLSRTEVGWRVENRTVAYDWVSAAAAAEQNGRPDWARWLMTGRAE